ncbi:MAG: beta-glucosidase [Anaerolineae bacterium]|nr:beta-glucosidase [Anaerolineae bacterium]
MNFPKDFVWGVAASSYQIEGAAREDGRGECTWTRFSHTPGKVKDGDTGDVACDHYHRYPEDIALMRDLGVHSYRFSVSWPRILPTGRGMVNEAGLDFYSRVVDALLAEGIQPAATLYHWDFPQALEDQGGWTNPDSVKWFVDYADVVTRALGDRVKFWVDFNEPWCSSMLGYLFGQHAPGVQDAVKAYRAAHHLMLAHGAVVPVIRQNSPGAQVGITLNPVPQLPATSSPEDIRLAWQADGFANRWFFDPVFKGSYPMDMVKLLGETLDGLDLDAVQSAAVPTDFLGINYYMRWLIEAIPGRPGEWGSTLPEGAELTAMGWEVYPQGLTDMLVRVHRETSVPAIYVTECGAAYPEAAAPVNGIYEDPKRVAFLKGYLNGAALAIQQGVPLKGFYVWSLLDNFEWAHGYEKRFGIVHVDFATQKRTLKRSALYFKDVIRNGAA